MDTADIQNGNALEQPWKAWLHQEIQARHEAEKSPDKHSEEQALRTKQESQDKTLFKRLDNAAG